MAAQKQSFGNFLWNSSTNEVLGRTGLSWAKIGFFYMIFYACLAGFFAIMLTAFYFTLEDGKPTYTGVEDSILKNPALGYRPLPKRSNIDSTLIQYVRGEKDNHWVGNLDEFIKPYNASFKVANVTYKKCSEDNKAGTGEVCEFNDSLLSETCQVQKGWGYNAGTPCILLKMNKMMNWEPKSYQTIDKLPGDMPQDLKDHIATTADTEGKIPQMVWVSCSGEDPIDDENLGTLKYSPSQGFPAYFFPYKNQVGYRNPLVAVEFSKPNYHTLISLTCKIWATNIKHNRKRRLGLAHFEILID